MEKHSTMWKCRRWLQVKPHNPDGKGGRSLVWSYDNGCKIFRSRRGETRPVAWTPAQRQGGTAFVRAGAGSRASYFGDRRRGRWADPDRDRQPGRNRAIDGASPADDVARARLRAGRRRVGPLDRRSRRLRGRHVIPAEPQAGDHGARRHARPDGEFRRDLEPGRRGRGRGGVYLAGRNP